MVGNIHIKLLSWELTSPTYGKTKPSFAATTATRLVLWRVSLFQNKDFPSVLVWWFFIYIRASLTGRLSRLCRFWSPSASTTARGCMFATFWLVSDPIELQIQEKLWKSQEECTSHQSVILGSFYDKCWFLVVPLISMDEWWLKTMGNLQPHSALSPAPPDMLAIFAFEDACKAFSAAASRTAFVAG